MAVVEVNYEALRAMADAIDAYCENQKNKMSNLDGTVKDMLKTGFIGQDALTFGGKWEGVDSSDSTACKFNDSLKNFSNSLRAAAKVYQTAQEDIYNLAILLPRW